MQELADSGDFVDRRFSLCYSATVSNKRLQKAGRKPGARGPSDRKTADIHLIPGILKLFA